MSIGKLISGIGVFLIVIGVLLYIYKPTSNVKTEIIQIEDNLCVVFIQRGNVNTVLKVDCPKGGNEK